VTLPISFLSDFGLRDEFVGVVHGVIARIAPEVRVLDITHGIEPGRVQAGALALLRAIQYVPEGVALAVVDPGVGTDRRAIAAKTSWGYFVGPDNGLLAPAVAMVGGAERIVSIENPELRLPAGGTSFDGRDLFGPAAAVLADGQASLDDLGPGVDPESVTPLMLPLAEHDPGRVRGEVLWVDHFGNPQTNITPEDLLRTGAQPGEEVVVMVGTTEYHLTWVASYGAVESGEGLVHADSYGQLAIAVRDGRADEAFPVSERVAVALRPVAVTAVTIDPAAGASGDDDV
jgi:S-adenosylmethionine hydrolase